MRRLEACCLEVAGCAADLVERDRRGLPLRPKDVLPMHSNTVPFRVVKKVESQTRETFLSGVGCSRNLLLNRMRHIIFTSGHTTLIHVP